MEEFKEHIRVLFNYLLKLDEGTYTKKIGSDNLKIEVKKGFVDGDIVEPNTISITKNDKLYFKVLLNDRYKNKEVYDTYTRIYSHDLNYELYFEGNQESLWNQSINLTQDKDKYYIKDGFIQNDTKSIRYEITEESIYTTIDNNTELDYELNTGNIYVYYKKYNNKTAYYDKDNSIKFKYSKGLYEIIEKYNELVTKSLEKLNYDVPAHELCDLVSTISISPLKVVTQNEINELIKAVDIYDKYYNKLECYGNEIMYEVLNFVQYLLDNPKEAKINKLTNMINEENLKDPKILTKVQKELNKIKKDTHVKRLERWTIKQ